MQIVQRLMPEKPGPLASATSRSAGAASVGGVVGGATVGGAVVDAALGDTPMLSILYRLIVVLMR